MRTETVTRELYTFDELSEKAKEKAREWFRQWSVDDYFWSESCMDDCKERLKLLGFDVTNIYWSGFWSQGDGACFDGVWSAGRADPAALRVGYSDKDPLAPIADALANIAKAYPDASATIEHSGYYSHEHCTSFDFASGTSWIHYPPEAINAHECNVRAAESSFIELARDAMREVYKALEREYNYTQSNECVDENILANEYEFTKEGAIA